jgi:hypothetical protein
VVGFDIPIACIAEIENTPDPFFSRDIGIRLVMNALRTDVADWQKTLKDRIS